MPQRGRWLHDTGIVRFLCGVARATPWHVSPCDDATTRKATAGERASGAGMFLQWVTKCELVAAQEDAHVLKVRLAASGGVFRVRG